MAAHLVALLLCRPEPELVLLGHDREEVGGVEEAGYASRLLVPRLLLLGLDPLLEEGRERALDEELEMVLPLIEDSALS